MTLPEVLLDDLRFQPLVNEARARLHELCPEWTEANVSDPGITLIELFAWMTDQLSYRINRLPEKLQVALLALLDVRLYPPTASTAQVRFALERPPEEALTIPAGLTEVSTARAQGQDPVVFQTVEDFTIRPLELDVYLLKRGSVYLNVNVSEGVALPAGGEEQQAFSSRPRMQDALLLGFGASLDRLVLRLEVDCARARGVGVDPTDPPLVWEASTGERDEDWVAVEKLSDTTEGFNEGKGMIELQLPPRVVQQSIGEHRLNWLRCRVTGAGKQDYSVPPKISKIRARPIGALLSAEHSQRFEDEPLGRSDGTPGQVFHLQRSPILDLTEHEGLEVREPGNYPVLWTEVDTFAASGPEDRHYRLDGSTGEVELGPAVRQPDGTFRAYGATPPPGAELRFRAYRHGGGTQGNVKAGALTRLRRPIPGVRAVTNPLPAAGGVDGETIGSARARTAIELRTANRAITARDFEQLCHVGVPELVARARCLPGARGEAVQVLIVPRIEQPYRRLEVHEFELDEQLIVKLADYLDQRRLVGVSVELKPPDYVGVTVVVRVVAEPYRDAASLERRIEERLYTYLNPLVGGASGSGWEFQRALGQGELYPHVQAVDGVQMITLLRVYKTDLRTGLEDPKPHEGDLVLGSGQLLASGSHRVKVEEQQP
ncbi:MAG TPA: putative baseplate assembly protein [Solirubrobacteraceae bacterium]|jgi:predicted phage baseplate assembly protein|nr:putative baseplate assembly protein [Solirubrobacteraceae bacterium]